MLRTFTMLLVVAALTACNPYTYVNIPPQQGDLARHGANKQLVRDVEAEAVRFLLSQRPIDGTAALRLPQGSTELTAADVARRAGDNVVAEFEARDPAAVVEITQVRVRGVNAEVDVLYPTLTGMPQLLTVYLEYLPMNNWVGQRVVDWPGATRPVDHGGAAEE